MVVKSGAVRWTLLTAAAGLQAANSSQADSVSATPGYTDCNGMSISPYFFIFLYRVTRLMPRDSAARERL